MIHPSVTALTGRVSRAIPDDLRALVPAWVSRHGLELDSVMRKALGNRLQLVELFAGIGGLGIGLETALNATTVLQAERVPERRQILQRWFPMALQLEDVRQVLAFPAPTSPDRLVLAGGFPCRGCSRANLSGLKGMENAETGQWSVMADVIRAWKRIVVITENVLSLRSRGLAVVLSDLISSGYDVLWGRLDASDFGAPHQRSRLFCVAIRSDAPSLPIRSRSHRPTWLPWSEGLPANDYRSSNRRARVAALGDSVVPIVAYTVGMVAAKLLQGWRPERSSLKTSPTDALPTNGWLADGRVHALEASPFQPAVRVEGQRWVVFDERFESHGSLDSTTYPPGVGRIYWWDGESDNVDIELPGGEVMPFPPEWVRETPWPTPVASDAKNRGARGQLDRHAPGLNALAQTDEWIAEDGLYGPELLAEVFGGRGVGLGFLEWVMGFRRGWTELVGADAGWQSESVRLKRLTDPRCSPEPSDPPLVRASG